MNTIASPSKPNGQGVPDAGTGDVERAIMRAGDVRAGPLLSSVLKQPSIAEGFERVQADQTAVKPQGIAGPSPARQGIAGPYPAHPPAGVKITDMGYGGVKRVDMAGQAPLFTNRAPVQSIADISRMKPGEVSLNGGIAAPADALTSTANPDFAKWEQDRKDREQIKLAAERGDLDTVKSYYASRGEGFGGQTADDIRAEQSAQAAQRALDQRNARRTGIANSAIARMNSIADELNGGRPMTRSQRGVLESLAGHYAGIAEGYGKEEPGMAPERVDAYRALAEQRLAGAERSRAAIQGESATTANRQRLSDLQQAVVDAATPEEREAAAQMLRQVQGREDRPRNALTLAQEARNRMIDAARTKLSGMTDKDVLARTQQYTSTGRENPTYDPELARAYRLANTRKIGADDTFDQFAGGGDGQPRDTTQVDNVAARFSADATMNGYSLGKPTEQGVEVFDRAGNLVGHYR